MAGIWGWEEILEGGNNGFREAGVRKEEESETNMGGDACIHGV